MRIEAANDFKLENFYLSELSTVISLYKYHIGQCCTNGKEEKKTPITSEFGLPLVVILQTKQVVGYASAIVTALNRVELNYVFFPEFQNKEIQLALELKAKRNFIQTFGNDEQSALKLKSAIEQLIYWLNL